MDMPIHSDQQKKLLDPKEAIRVRFLGHDEKDAIVFSPETSDTIIHPDDSIRTVKMKILHELHRGRHSDALQLRPSYEEMYLYVFAEEETTTLRLFDALKTVDEPNPSVPRDLIAQMLEGHPKAESILQKLPKTSGEKIPYEDFAAILSEKKLTLSVKTPLGIQFNGPHATFESDPFYVDKFHAYKTEHNNVNHFDDSLLLNYCDFASIVDRTIYVCLAEHAFGSTKNADVEDYISRYYFPGLFKAGIKSKDDLSAKRGKLVRHTIDLLTDARLRHYQSLQAWYDISSDPSVAVQYSERGIKSVSLRLKNAESHIANLELIFRNMHCTLEIPYIKFNPGNRRDNLFRFYFERTTRSGKKIPYLSRAHIMRMSKETGRPQQISAYLESVVLLDHKGVRISNCYANFERTGDVQIQLKFARPIDEKTLDEIMREHVMPALSSIGRDVKQTGFDIPNYTNIRDQNCVQIVSMEYSVLAPAKKTATIETIPCVYSICTLHSDPPMARLKRVENFRDMDAARILVAELYGEIQYGEMTLLDIVGELVSQKLVESEDDARILIADVLSQNNEINGEIVERPGFPIAMEIDKEDNLVNVRVEGLTSIRYLDTVAVYVDSIIKLTQLMDDKHPLVKRLNKSCKKARKFKEVESAEQEVAPALLNDAVKAPVNIGPLRFDRNAAVDLFGPIVPEEEPDDQEEEEYQAPQQVVYEDEENADVEEMEANDLISRLHKNLKETAAPKKPLVFDSDEDDDEDEEQEEPKNEPNEKERVKPSAAAAAIPKKPLVFDSDEDEEQEEDDRRKWRGGSKKRGPAKTRDPDPDSDTDSDTSDDDDRIVPDGIPLEPVNPFLKKLRKRDPTLFATKPNANYKSFAVSCQPTSRHPVILTQEEFDRTDKAAYEHSIKYGSDPNNPHYFICPRFWCFLTNSAISEEDVKAGKCGKIIPKGSKTVPKGAYVYELNNKTARYPGFAKDTRPDGKCYPCCSANWNGEKQREARERCLAQEPANDGANMEKKKTTKAAQQKTEQYIISLDTYPVPQTRWGYLPIPVQLFLNIDYKSAVDPNNPALILQGKRVLLRGGVEQPPNQSFMGVFAHIYAHRQGLDSPISVADFREVISKAIDLDAFSKAHNGSLLSAFFKPGAKPTKTERAKYTDTEFASNLDLSTKPHKQYLDDAIAAYKNFHAYLSDPEQKIDHQYLWDFICADNARIIPRGLNLVMLEIKANDIIDRIEIVCPTNLYSSHQFDATKDSVIVLKRDDVYEPVFLYEQAEPKNSVRFFQPGQIPADITAVLKIVETSTKKYCPGMPSLPRIYEFANPVPLNDLVSAMESIDAKVKAQISNYQGKTIGIMVLEPGKKRAVYVPCAPSARKDGVPVKYMDSEDIPQDYEHTAAALNRISNRAKIPCKPVRKMKEDGLVVGFLTETNQFVPITPNEDIIMDGLREFESVDVFKADKTVATKHKGDRKREKIARSIALESQFYHAFRNRVRTLINQHANRESRHNIRRVTEDPTILYRNKMAQVESLLRDLIDGYVVFVDISKRVLKDLAEVNDCDDQDQGSPNCLIKENGVAQLVVPKRHLLSKYDNEEIYVGRMADELIRNDRVKAFMYDTQTRLNAKNVEYSVKDNEFILVQSALTPEYFADMDGDSGLSRGATTYANKTNYELASPSISVLYPNEKISLEEQQKFSEPADADDSNNCLDKVVPIIGNQLQIWGRIFPADTREWVFRNTALCTYQPIIRIVEDVLGEKWSDADTRRHLWSAYSEMFERTPELIGKVAAIMRKQGKSKMFERIARNAKMDSALSEFESIVNSDHYHLTDMDMWALSEKFDLPIIVFNPNGLKGFFAKLDVQWVRMGPKMDKRADQKYHFIRSNIGSYPNEVYKYNLVVPSFKLNKLKEFETKFFESIKNGLSNTYALEEALSKIAFIETKLLKAAAAKMA